MNNDMGTTGSAAGNVPHIPGRRRPLPELSQPKRRGFSSRGVLLFAIVTILGVAVFLKDRNGSGDAQRTLGELSVGDCIEQAEGDQLDDVREVSCDDTHRVEVYAVGTATATIGDDPSVDPQILRICRDEVAADVDPGVRDAEADGASLGFLVDGTRTGKVACTINTQPRTGSYLAEAPSPDA